MRGDNTRLLKTQVRTIFGNEYDMHEKQYDKIFTFAPSTDAFETDVQYEGFGLAEEKAEGAGIAYDKTVEGYAPRYVNVTYAKGFKVTKENMADNKYNLFDRRARALAFSMAQTKENVMANIINRGQNATYVMPGGDGKPLFATDHRLGPSNAGTFSNRLAVNAALSASALEDLLILIDQATDARGLNIKIKGLNLVGGTGLRFEMARILDSTHQDDTNNNAINAFKTTGVLEGGYSVNNYFNTTTKWVVRTNCPEGLKYQERQSIEFNEDNEFDTSNLCFKADERYTGGWTDPRGCYQGNE